MNTFIIAFLSITVTCGTYIIARWFYLKYPFPLLIPIVIASACIIFILSLFDVSYDTYMVGGELISKLLGPAVVALAYPLYKQGHLLKKYAFPVTVGSLTGALVGILSGVLLAKLFKFADDIIFSLTPKSVTTPIAMEVSANLGGHMSLAAVFVIIAGVTGAVLSSYIYKCFHINDTIGRGVGIGSGSHAIGTAKALENSELEGSLSTVAMILSMIFVSIFAPILLPYLLL